MKRILILIKGLGRGGAEQLLVNAARYSDTQTFDYEFAYLLPHKNALVKELENLGFPVTCLSGSRGLGWTRRLARLVREREIDLLHAHLPYSAIGARLALRGARRPVLVYTEHNVWERYHKATYWANLLTYPRNDRVFAVSNDVRASVCYPRLLGKMRMPPLETLYHGADHAAIQTVRTATEVRSELGIPHDAPVVGTVANFKTHKGHRYLIEAIPKVLETAPDTRFVLVGLGPLQDDIALQAKRLGLNGAVIFTGFREDVLDVANTFDLFALPSLHEGLSIALVEVMALGKPSVVTPAGGVPEVIENGKQGLIVPTRDPEAMATSILTLIARPDLRTRMGDAARRRSADFDIRTATTHMEQVYLELLE